ncbi:MAG: hypothetical protein AB7Y74_06225 [Syntrophorhabdus sp.]
MVEVIASSMPLINVRVVEILKKNAVQTAAKNLCRFGGKNQTRVLYGSILGALAGSLGNLLDEAVPVSPEDPIRCQIVLQNHHGGAASNIRENIQILRKEDTDSSAMQMIW